MPNDLATCMETIPPALDELAKSQGTVQQIALYCKAAYQEGADVNAVFEQTKNYTNDALQNVVYHVHNVGLQITNFLEVQMKEIEKIDLQVRLLSERMRACHEASGAPDKQLMEAPHPYNQALPSRKLAGHELPWSAQPLQPLPRTIIDLNALDGVGNGDSSITSSRSGAPSPRSISSSSSLASPHSGFGGPPPPPMSSGAPPPPPPDAGFAPPPPPY